MTTLKYTAFLLAFIAGACISSVTLAQGVYNFLPQDTGDWDTGTNWNGPFGAEVPAANFGDAALINSGGTAQVSNTPAAVGAVVIDNGGVTITSSGNLTTSANTGADPAATGNFTVNGGGNLRMVGGGQLTVGVDLNLGGTFTAELTAAAQNPIGVAGQANIGGNLVAEINGATVNSTSTFNLIDATSITGNFASVTSTGTPLPVGQVFGVQQVAGGANGNLVQLFVEQRLVLNVNRDTGIVSIQNSGSASANLNLDYYLIESANGSLNPAGWNSFADQGFENVGNPWAEAGEGAVTPNDISEFNATASATLAPGASRAIGTIYDPNFAGVPLTEETEDYTFSYSNNGQLFEGVVNYVGDKQEHNIVLTVDPTTGQAVMQNESGVGIAIDSYTIASESGSLLTSWNSLQDQAAPGGTWLEANPSSNRLSELTSDGLTYLGTNEGFNLSTLFNTGSAQDLTFQYIFADSTTVFDGIVEYGSLPTNLLAPTGPIPGDYNFDTVVDAADYTVWRDGNSPDSSIAGYLAWKENFGFGQNIGGALTSAPVPEPSSVSLALLLVAAALQGNRYRSRS